MSKIRLFTIFATITVLALLAVVAIQTATLVKMKESREKGGTETVSASSAATPLAPSVPPTPGSPSPTPLDPMVPPWTPTPIPPAAVLLEEMEKALDEISAGIPPIPTPSGLQTQRTVRMTSGGLRDTGAAWVYQADMPGIDPEKIRVDIRDGMFSLSTESSREVTETDATGNKVTRSVSTGSFRQSMSLPGPVKLEEIKVTYENDVLNVLLPKETAPSP